nr:squamous cell carcinoma antigen recognized by T-cells 3 [Leptinotarsa decemlineata]
MTEPNFEDKMSVNEESMNVDEDENSDSSSSSSDNEESQLLIRAEDLEKQISANENLYAVHEELVDIYRKTEDLNSMREAYERFRKVFPLTPKLWLDWLRIEVNLANTSGEKDKLFTLFEQAVEDYLSVELWVEFAQFSIGACDVAKTRSVLEQGLTSAGLHASEGSLLWDTLRELENARVSLFPDNSEEWKNQLCKLADVFKRQLSVPLLNTENTYQEWQEWSKTLPEGLVDPKPVEWAYKKSKQLLEIYKEFEERLLTAESTELLNVYKEYIKVVKDPSTVLCLYERAVAALCLTPQLWEEYCMYAFKLGEVADKVSKRAVRNCPWSEELWILRLRILEACKKDKKIVLKCFEEGLANVSTNLDLWLTYIEYTYRNGNDNSKLDRLFAQAQEQVPLEIDTTNKLGRLHAKLVAKRGDLSAARKKWGEIMGQQQNKDKASVWLEYANFERQYGDASHLRTLFKKALLACKDWPQYIAEEWLMFERESGTLEDVMNCWQKCRTIPKAVVPLEPQALEPQEIVEQPEQRRYQPDKNKKRKQFGPRNDVESKRPKFVHIPEDKVAARPSATNAVDKNPKTTVFVSNLHPAVDENRLRELFPNAVQIEVVQDKKGKSRCFGYVQFSKEEEVMVALARDRVPIDGRPLFISEINPGKAERKPAFKYANALEEHKLFVKGLPLDKTIQDVKEIFKPYSPVDVRLVSKRNGVSKGIAFVEFKTSDEAQTALKALDKSTVGDNTIEVAISAPPPKGTPQQKPVDEPIRHSRSRLQIPMVPRSVQVKKAEGGVNGSGSEGKKSNADFRNMLLKK